MPEIWIATAEATGIEELRRTTRDEPDYDKLMRYRLEVLARNDLRLPDIEAVIDTLEPLEGAVEFTQWLVSQTRLIVLSDTFVQFARPLMAKLHYPTLFCHELEVDPQGRITGYRLRQPDQKHQAVRAFQGLNFTVIAAGDSFNDRTMLQAADEAILFRPPPALTEAEPQIPVTRTYAQLREKLAQALVMAS